MEIVISFLFGIAMGAFFAVLIVRPDLRQKLFDMMNKNQEKPVKKSRIKRVVK